MKKTGSVSLLVVAAVLSMADLAMADSYTGSRSPYTFGDSGEITAKTTPNSYLPSYVSSTIVNGGFETFAEESGVKFFLDTPYDYTLSQFDHNGTALTQGAALLYYDFAKGILPEYDYTSADPYFRIQDARDLQAALWYLQGSPNASSDYPFGGMGNEFYDYAAAQLGSDITAANNGKYDVAIIQLWDQQGNAAQNQFVAPAPDNGFTAALLGLPVALMAAVKRRKW